MEIKTPDEDEIFELTDIYKTAFRKHNIFTKPSEEILTYLKQAASSDEIIIAKKAGQVIGGLLLRLSTSSDGHKVWKINHLAIHPELRNQSAATTLLKEAEKRISERSLTAKVELNVSENEKGTIPIFQKLGYEIEGKFKSHYRHGELVYALGKELHGQARSQD